MTFYKLLLVIIAACIAVMVVLPWMFVAERNCDQFPWPMEGGGGWGDVPPIQRSVEAES